MELGLVIAGREVDDAKHLRLQCSDPVDYLLDVWDGPAFQCPSGRVESYVVEGEAPLLGCAFRCGLRDQVDLAPFRRLDNA